MQRLMAYLKRIKIFLSERYPFHLSIPQCILAAISLVCATNVIYERNESIFSLKLLWAVLTSYTYLMVMRVADEFKDREVDKVLFKERCLPAGKVKYSDIAILGVIGVLAIIGFHFVGGANTVNLVFAMVFLFLFSQYFFFPKIIGNNLILALVTHCPITLVLYSYIITYFTPNSAFSPAMKLTSIAAGMWMAAIAWETARKIRIPEDENDYTTYSKVLGYRAATFLPFTALSAQVFFYGWPLHIVPVFALLYLPFGIFFLSFVFFPSRKKSVALKTATEIYVFLGMILIITKGVFFNAY